MDPHERCEAAEEKATTIVLTYSPVPGRAWTENGYRRSRTGGLREPHRGLEHLTAMPGAQSRSVAKNGVNDFDTMSYMPVPLR